MNSPTLIEKVYVTCGRLFQARLKDAERGFARYCSKACNGKATIGGKRRTPVQKLRTHDIRDSQRR